MAAETSPSHSPLSRTVQITLLVVSFAAMILASVVGIQRQADANRLRTYIACQAAVNEASALAARERSVAADVDRAADRDESTAARELILEVFTTPAGPDARDKIRASFVQYEQALRAVDARRADAEQQRRTHPLPPLPSETCRD